MTAQPDQRPQSTPGTEVPGEQASPCQASTVDEDAVRRVGIMGGTFDPIHLGHLSTAEQARADLRLDEVVFIPSGQPAQKRETTPAELRYLMTVLATAANPYFSVSRLEIDRDGPTYTVETLRTMRSGRPGDRLFFITGADAILNILTWKDAQECLELAEFVAATRPGYDLTKLDRQDIRRSVTVLDVPALAISSTDLRRRLQAGRPVRYLVPREVEEFAWKHGLYGTRRPPAPAALHPADVPGTPTPPPPRGVGGDGGSTGQPAGSDGSDPSDRSSSDAAASRSSSPG